jgi:hypothetical protein
MSTFVRGDLSPVAFRTPTTFFNITGYSLDHTILLFDVTHTGLGGAGTARIAGKPDMKGTVNYDLDIDLAPFGATLSVLPGTSGIMYWYISNTNVPGNILGKAIQVPVIVEKLHWETAITSQVKGTIDVSMDALASGGTGPTFPTAAGFMIYPAAA